MFKIKCLPMEEKKEKSHSGKKKYESQLTSHMKSKTVESKENKNTNLKRYMHPCYCSITYKARYGSNLNINR